MRNLRGLFLAGALLIIASCSAGGGTPSDPTASGGALASGGGTGVATGGAGGAGGGLAAGGAVSGCFPKTYCNGTCVEIASDSKNCGSCGHVCGATQTCEASACACSPGLNACGDSCANFQSDAMNCGSCGNVCGQGLFCSKGACVAACATEEMACEFSCATLLTDAAHCGSCTNACVGGQACAGGVCGCQAGEGTCDGQCVNLQADLNHCGDCAVKCASGEVCASGACTIASGVGGGSSGGAGNVGGSGGGAVETGGSGAGGAPAVVRPNGCAIKPGMISDFEDGEATPLVIASEDRSGEWEIFNDGKSTNETLAVESSGGTAECDKNALHVKGSGYSEWGAGVGVSLVGTPKMPTAYNATVHGFTGIRFKAKQGSGADAKSPVRFNISTPWTESKENSGGTCTPTTSSDTKAAADCYQHAGRFLSPGTGTSDLTSSWKAFSYCFDRDLYPLSLPSNLTTDQRNNIGTNILKVQFQFNQGKDYSGSYPSDGKFPDFKKELAFDFWIDDVEFFSGDCPNTVTSPSNNSPAKAFPQNTAVGSCTPPATASKFAGAISDIYARWTKTFVQNDRIVAPEQQNAITSEAMGYGMMIAAAMGDKTAFDKFHGYVKGQGGSGSGLMTWKTGQSGSASDADIDIAYALLMGNVQWPSGGYKGPSDQMAAAILSQDLVSNVIRGGSSFHDAPFNASYFAPAAFRAFGSSFGAALSANYNLVNANVNASTKGVPTDWANPSSGAPSGPGSAQVTSEIIDGDNGAMGYDAARVPWRLGLDVCKGGTDNTALSAIVSYFAGKYDQGASIDLMKAGWYKKQDKVHPASKDLQGSYLGPMGVGALAMKNDVMRDRAFRVLLDILESGDYNHTYFPSTVGLLTLLLMSGNFPTP